MKQLPALAPPAAASPHLQMLDVAIALLTAARGRHPDQVAALIEASQIILGVASPAAAIAAPPADAPRKPRAQARRTPKAAKPKRQAAPVARSAAPPAAEPQGAVELHGITVCFDADAESVSHGDRSIEITARQAAFVAALVRAMPSPCAREFIAKRLWSKPPQFADQILGTIAAELKSPLAGIGLKIETVRGVGFVLAEA